MKNSNLVIGIIFIFLGVFWMLYNTGIIDWSLWLVLTRLWPLILVVIGINIIFKGRKVINVLTWLIFLTVIIVYGFFGPYKYEGFNDDALVSRNPNVVIEKHEETKFGDLDLKLGGANIDLDSTDKGLVNAFIPNPRVKNKVTFKDNNKSAQIEFEQSSYMLGSDRKRSYSYRFSLNDGILWSINGDIGAVNGTFDFSNLMVDKVNLNLGAANIKLIFGNKAEFTQVNIDGGASNIDLKVPEDVGVRIKVDGLLKNTNIKDLGWDYSDKCYTSPNYNEMKKKIDIDVSIGVGKFDVIVD